MMEQPGQAVVIRGKARTRVPCSLLQMCAPKRPWLEKHSAQPPAPGTPNPGTQWVPTPAASQGAVLTRGCKKAIISSAENLMC